ncbi:gallidermin/nisin family lantibiotic [Apilactobacillus kunkeei]|uniref:gallidermin/nisin family lantibiotic n=1 Tax=Apilactobacillus kunkeei TaxID=148814 RepID=UPI00200ACDDF|nr:gallidermin/nisin family lantibiotic [Apilactobacillus kunkeei]MCK8635998.1 gallidermin/nisin family lantibiotic [Apilactobacillus kunkeei]
MSNFNDFNLGIKKVHSGSKKGLEPRITSVVLCTPGCITGRLMGCNNKTKTCHCHSSNHFSFHAR